jgi:hypothetical protein
MSYCSLFLLLNVIVLNGHTTWCLYIDHLMGIWGSFQSLATENIAQDILKQASFE